MSRRLLFPLLLVFAATMSCILGMPEVTPPPTRPVSATRVTAVSVQPFSARLGESFAVGVAYTRGTDKVDTLTCSLPSNNQPGTLSISLDLSFVSAGPQTWAFTVVPNATGNFFITCEAIGQSDTVTAELMVEAEQPQATATSTALQPAMVWQQIGTGDCGGYDVNSTDGSSTPEPNLAAPGLIAVCWDGQTYVNSNAIGKAFCTYKSIPADQCVDGGNIGEMYQAVSP